MVGGAGSEDATALDPGVDIRHPIITYMPKVIESLEKAGLKVRVMIGGTSVSQSSIY